MLIGVTTGEPGYLPFAIIGGWIFGILIGYLGGTLVAGVFLVADIIRGGNSAAESNPTVGFDDLTD